MSKSLRKPVLSLFFVLVSLQFVICLVHAEGQTAAPQVAPSSSELEVGIVEQAAQLRADGDLRSAQRLLQPLASSDSASGPVLLLLGVILQEEGEHYLAIPILRRAATVLGRTARVFSWSRDFNVQQRIGISLIKLRQYKEAITPLTEACVHPSELDEDEFLSQDASVEQGKDGSIQGKTGNQLSTIRPRTTDLLALAYEQSDNPRQAYCVNVSMIVRDPNHLSAWHRIQRIRPRLGTDFWGLPLDCPLAPPPLAIASIHRVIEHGPSDGWSPDVAVRAFVDYSALADDLEKIGRVRHAIRHRRYVANMVFGSAANAIVNGKDEYALRLLERAYKQFPMAAVPLYVQVEMLKAQVYAYVGMEKFTNAVFALEKAYALRSADREVFYPSVDSVRGFLLLEAFYSVSFDRRTGALRESDADDFLGEDIPASAASAPLAGGPPHPLLNDFLGENLASSTASAPQAGRRPYGSLSPTEDHATVGASMLDANLHGTMGKLQALIAARIHKGNLELPVKFLLNDLFSCGVPPKRMCAVVWSPSLASNSLLAALDRAMTTPGARIPESTVIAYGIAKKLLDFSFRDVPLLRKAK